MFRLIVQTCLISLFLFAATAAQAERRVALVIGNNDYESLPKLANAVTDAKSITAQLSKAGFEVTTLINAGRTDIFRAKAVFESKLTRADAGLIFYAGHGIQSQGINWLIPVDAQIKIEADLPAWGIDAQDLLATMESTETPVNILILDACRDNPLPKRTRSAARGLRALTARPTVGGLVVFYAAGEGQTAQDGPDNGNGLFTGALLETMAQPGLTLEQVFKKTAARVVESTGGTQRPWYHGSLTGDFYFHEAGRDNVQQTALSATPQTGAHQGQQPTPKPDISDQQELVFWQSIKDTGSPAELEAFLTQFPDGVFAGLAKVRLRELTEAAQQQVQQQQVQPRQAQQQAPQPQGQQQPSRRPAQTAALPAQDAPPVGRALPGPTHDPRGGAPGPRIPADLQRQNCGGGASFDCRKARSSVEHAICRTPPARQLDCWLGATYLQARKRLDSAGRKALRDEQRQWIATRDAKCGRTRGRQQGDCIRLLTERRLNELVQRYAINR